LIIALINDICISIVKSQKSQDTHHFSCLKKWVYSLFVPSYSTPEVTEFIDAIDHSPGTNPFYKNE